MSISCGTTPLFNVMVATPVSGSTENAAGAVAVDVAFVYPRGEPAAGPALLNSIVTLPKGSPFWSAIARSHVLAVVPGAQEKLTRWLSPKAVNTSDEVTKGAPGSA